MKRAFSILLTILLTIYVVTLPAALLMMYMASVSGPGSAPPAAMLVGFLLVVALFLLFAKYKAKGKIITVSLSCVLLLAAFLASLGGFRTAAALNNRFPDIATWPVQYDKSIRTDDYVGIYAGRYAFYDMENSKFSNNELPADSVQDISVIVFYAYSSRSQQYNYAKTGGGYWGAVTLRDMTVYLVDAETRVCFAKETIHAKPSTRAGEGLKKGQTFSVRHSDYELRHYIDGFFR